MLRIYASQDVNQAKSYYTAGLSREDYYSKGQESPGLWKGEGAKLLGLDGAVCQDKFNALCENLHPETLDQLTPKTVENRRVGYDFNFNAPKSLSLLHALGGDHRLLGIFQSCVDKTMREI